MILRRLCGVAFVTSVLLGLEAVGSAPARPCYRIVKRMATEGAE
jgi:hypothetical protein